jgi:hypothetical protein
MVSTDERGGRRYNFECLDDGCRHCLGARVDGTLTHRDDGANAAAGLLGAAVHRVSAMIPRHRAQFPTASTQSADRVRAAKRPDVAAVDRVR